jgi:hypothetical protein
MKARSLVTFVHVVPLRSTCTLMILGWPPPKFSSSGTSPRLAECPKCLLWPEGVTEGFPRRTLRSFSRLRISTGLVEGSFTVVRHNSARVVVSVGSLRRWEMSSSTSSSGSFRSELMMNSALETESAEGAETASRLMPVLAAETEPILERRLSLSAS